MPKFTLPTPSRRGVLLGLAGGGAAAGLLSLPALRDSAATRRSASPFTGKRKPMPQASLEQWASEIGSVFYVATEAGALALTLVTVTALPVVGKRPSFLRARPFEARFEAAGGKSLPGGDRLYPLRHAVHGEFQLYFGAVGKALSATFN